MQKLLHASMMENRELKQGFHNSLNLQYRNIASTMRHGLLNRQQASSYGARKVPGIIPNRKCIIKIIKQDWVHKRPNRTGSYFVPNFTSPSPTKPCRGDNPESDNTITDLLSAVMVFMQLSACLQDDRVRIRTAKACMLRTCN